MAVEITAGPYEGEQGEIEPSIHPKPRVIVQLDDGRRVAVDADAVQDA